MFEHLTTGQHHGFVNRLTKYIAMMMLALWMPVTVHCALETMPGFSFLQLCCGDDSSQEKHHDCSEDSCSAVESGLYMIEENTALNPALVAFESFADLDTISARPTSYAHDFLPASSAPPDLPRVWQFHYRTALPPRAPSLIA